jgi:hypothetical protein
MFLPPAVAGRACGCSRRQALDQLGDVLGGLRLVLRRVAHQHLGHAGDLGAACFGRGAAAGTGHQHMDVAAELRGGGHGVERRALSDCVVVFGNNENGHVQITFASFLSLSTSWRHVGHLDAGAALGRLGDLERLQARRDVDAQVGRLDGVERLLLGLHDVGQRGVARLVQAQVGGDHRRQAHRQGLQAAVDLAGHRDLCRRPLRPWRRRCLRPARQRGQHLAGLVGVVVDGLLAQDHQARLFLVAPAP